MLSQKFLLAAEALLDSLMTGAGAESPNWTMSWFENALAFTSASSRMPEARKWTSIFRGCAKKCVVCLFRLGFQTSDWCV